MIDQKREKLASRQHVAPGQLVCFSIEAKPARCGLRVLLVAGRWPHCERSSSRRRAFRRSGLITPIRGGIDRVLDRAVSGI